MKKTLSLIALCLLFSVYSIAQLKTEISPSTSKIIETANSNIVGQLLSKSVSAVNEPVVIYEEGIEGETVQLSQIDANADDNKWMYFQETDIDVAHSGSWSAGFSSIGITADDWLLSTKMALPADNTIEFSFWAKSYNPDFMENFDVKLSTTTRTPADFTVSLQEVRDASSEWTKYTYDLSAFAGDSISFGIHGISVDEHYLFIDDFLVTASEAGTGNVTADFSLNISYGQIPQQVQFNNLSSGDITSWLWNFGDGTTSTEQDPNHTYTIPGNFTISLQVSNQKYSNTKQITNGLAIIDDYSIYGWKKLYTTTVWGGFGDLHFFDTQNGLIIDGSDILKTTDGGQSWSKVADAEHPLVAFDFADSQNGFVSSLSGYIMKTTDGGANWTKIENVGVASSLAVDFVESFTKDVLIVVARGWSSSVILRKSTDGGTSWTDIDIGISEDKLIKKISLANDSIGYFIHSLNDAIELYKTEDQGTTWTLVNTFGTGTVRDIEFTDKNQGVILIDTGSDASIWKTKDGGINLTETQIPGTAPECIYPLIPDLIFYGGGSGTFSGNNCKIFNFLHNPFEQMDFNVGDGNAFDAYSFPSFTVGYASIGASIYRFEKNTSSLSHDHIGNLKLYPNPTQGKITMELPKPGNAVFELFNMRGQKIQTQIISSYQTQVDINLNAARGVYMYKLQHGNEVYYGKLIIE